MRTWLSVAVIALLATSGSAIGTAARQATPTNAPSVSDSSRETPRLPGAANEPGGPGCHPARGRLRKTRTPSTHEATRCPPPTERRSAISSPRGNCAWPPVTYRACSDSSRRTGSVAFSASDRPSSAVRPGCASRSCPVSQVERLRDGRIAARVAVDPTGSGAAPPESLIAIVEQSEDGVWRIDHLRVAGGTGWRRRHGRARPRRPAARAAAPPDCTRSRSAGPRSRTDRADARGRCRPHRHPVRSGAGRRAGRAVADAHGLAFRRATRGGPRTRLLRRLLPWGADPVAGGG